MNRGSLHPRLVVAAETTYSVESEDTNNLVPGQVDIGRPAHDLGQPLCHQITAVVRLGHGECFAGKAAGEGVPALGDRMAAMDLAPHEIPDSERVGRVCVGSELGLL